MRPTSGVVLLAELGTLAALAALVVLVVSKHSQMLMHSQFIYVE